MVWEMFLNMKMTREAKGITLFFFVGCFGLQKYPIGLQSNLYNWERKWSDEAHLCTIWHPEEEKERETAVGTAGTAFSLLILLATSGIHRYQFCCYSDPCRTVRCPSQTEHHPQLHAFSHDCSRYSNYLLLLWSL